MGDWWVFENSAIVWDSAIMYRILNLAAYRLFLLKDYMDGLHAKKQFGNVWCKTFAQMCQGFGGINFSVHYKIVHVTS